MKFDEFLNNRRLSDYHNVTLLLFLVDKPTVLSTNNYFIDYMAMKYNCNFCLKYITYIKDINLINNAVSMQ